MLNAGLASLHFLSFLSRDLSVSISASTLFLLDFCSVFLKILKIPTPDHRKSDYFSDTVVVRNPTNVRLEPKNLTKVRLQEWSFSFSTLFIDLQNGSKWFLKRLLLQMILAISACCCVRLKRMQWVAFQFPDPIPLLPLSSFWPFF